MRSLLDFEFKRKECILSFEIKRQNAIVSIMQSFSEKNFWKNFSEKFFKKKFSDVTKNVSANFFPKIFTEFFSFEIKRQNAIVSIMQSAPVMLDAPPVSPWQHDT